MPNFNRLGKVTPMEILLLEPYFTGSHAAWANDYARHSQHEIKILKMRGHFWKWRMHGGAVTLAKKFLASGFKPDLLLATDMLDLTTFLALTRFHTAPLPAAIYFHENQLSYPWSPQDRDLIQKRDKHYGFINYASALAAEAVFFNSQYHRDSFLGELPRLLKHFPDYNELDSVDYIAAKSSILPLGLDLEPFDIYNPTAATPLEKSEPSSKAAGPANNWQTPLILWNHRWEYDKNPELFFRALVILADQGLDFEVAILGKNFGQQPEAFKQARQELGKRVIQFGYVEDFATYAAWLWRADLLPVTSNQEFFGASLMQALYCNCYPLLPKRLAYPELIPADRQADYFYDDLKDLVERLAVAIQNINSIRQQSLRPVAAQYRWELMAPRYDEAFKKIAAAASLA